MDTPLEFDPIPDTGGLMLTPCDFRASGDSGTDPERTGNVDCQIRALGREREYEGRCEACEADVVVCRVRPLAGKHPLEELRAERYRWEGEAARLRKHLGDLAGMFRNLGEETAEWIAEDGDAAVGQSLWQARSEMRKWQREALAQMRDGRHWRRVSRLYGRALREAGAEFPSFEDEFSGNEETMAELWMTEHDRMEASRDGWMEEARRESLDKDKYKVRAHQAEKMTRTQERVIAALREEGSGRSHTIGDRNLSDREYIEHLEERNSELFRRYQQLERQVLAPNRVKGGDGGVG